MSKPEDEFSKLGSRIMRWINEKPSPEERKKSAAFAENQAYDAKTFITDSP